MRHISDFFGTFSKIFERSSVLQEAENWCSENGVSLPKGSAKWKGEDICIHAPQSRAATLFMKKEALSRHLKEKFPDISIRTIRFTA